MPNTVYNTRPTVTTAYNSRTDVFYILREDGYFLLREDWSKFMREDSYDINTQYLVRNPI